jgi:hypothetical protein
MANLLIIFSPHNFQTAARVPDMPWSLYEGWSGALCFLVDLYKPEKAQFPLVPIQFGD